MGRLIKAEFRKILTTRLWWAMMIPALLLAMGWAWGVSALITDIVDDVADEEILTQFDITIDELSWSSIALTRSMNIATIFPMIFGALALASEINRKTITTSFLTAPNRGSVLTAKALTYIVWGLLYGVVIGIGASLGTAVGGGDYLPEGGDWIMIVLSGVLGCLLWTLLGLGIGALLGSPVGALVLLLIYSLIVGPIGDIVMTGLTEGSYLAGFLPNGSANGLTGSTASQVLFTQVQDLILNVGGGAVSADDEEGFEQVVRALAGAPGALSLWISGAIFLGWTAVFFFLGILRNRTRDIT